ncbi:hypothetical protein [Priestia aryabhattai]
MLDKYDLFYGIEKNTQEKFVYWIYSAIFNVVLLLCSSGKSEFLFLKQANNPMEFYLLGLSIFFLGLIFYVVFIIFLIILDIKRFKKQEKSFFIYTRILNKSQKTKVLKKLFIRKDLYTLIAKTDVTQNLLSESKWKYYFKKIGSKKNIILKLKLLHFIEKKIKEDEPLNDKEIDYINDLLFSKEDLSLFHKLEKDIKKYA